MATEEQLKDALVRAHRAGDTRAANLFAEDIKRMRAAGAAPAGAAPAGAAPAGAAPAGVAPAGAAPAGAAPGVFERLTKGALDPFDAAAQLAERGAQAIFGEDIVSKINAFNNRLAEIGLVAPIGEKGVAEDIAQREREYQARREAAGVGENVDWWRMAGGVLSPANLVPGGAASLPGRIAAGAAMGAVSSPVTDTEDFWGEKAAQMSMGAAIPVGLRAAGAAVRGAGKAVGSVLNPNISEDAARLVSIGVNPTVGQLLGPRAAGVESRLAGLPFIGGQIQDRLDDVAQEFNLRALENPLSFAGINPATVRAGRDISENIGQQGIAPVKQAVSNKFSEVYQNIPEVSVMPTTNNPIENFLNETSGLIGTHARRARNIITNNVLPRTGRGVDPTTGEPFRDLTSEIRQVARDTGGTITGPQLNDLISELRETAASFSKGTGDDINLANSIKDLVSDLRGQLPQKEQHQLENLDKSWASLKVLERAQGKAVEKEGVFQPKQLQRAAREQAVKRGYEHLASQGDALLQDYANLGQRVLGTKQSVYGRPDYILTGGIGLGAFGLGAGVNPLLAALPAAALTGLYTKTGQKMASDFLLNRPQWARRAGTALKNIPRSGGPLSAYGRRLQMPAVGEMSRD